MSYTFHDKKVGESQFTAIYSFVNYTKSRPRPTGRGVIVECRPKIEVMQAAAQAPHASVAIISVRVPGPGSQWCAPSMFGTRPSKVLIRTAKDSWVLIAQYEGR
jgi:hypothetical protein